MHKVSEQRSRNMSAIKSKNTKPEIAVRKLLYSIGYRFRLHRKDLPGSPDIVLPKYKTEIFVHGCFWHRHENCKYASTPRTIKEFWENKFKANVKRDKEIQEKIKNTGWKSVVIWECETKNIDDLRESPSIFIIQELIEKGFKIKISEPNIKEYSEFNLSTVDELIRESEIIVLLVAHDQFLHLNFSNKLILDFCGLLN